MMFKKGMCVVPRFFMHTGLSVLTALAILLTPSASIMLAMFM